MSKKSAKQARRKPARHTQIETLESRQVMSADPLGGLLGGSISHHAIEEEPQLIQHGDLGLTQPGGVDYSHHADPNADFWLDDQPQLSLEEQLDQIEKSLSSAHQQTGMDHVRTDYGFSGVGQTVAVIDSGIAYDHYALGGGLGSNYRVVGGYDFTESDSDPYDDGTEGSHGTHVAGIVGADDGDRSGVAPGVDLVGLRVFSDTGAGYFSWVESALQWVHDNRNSFENPITAVNLSLGTSWNSSSIPYWAMLENEFAQLEADGIFISVSAGNSYTSYNTPGLSYPAASPYVVPVMSSDDSGFLSYFSQRHERAIAAPGRYIYSTVPDYAGNNNGVTDDWANFSGTSMAAPYVAGASVIIREAMEFVGYTGITQDTIYDHMIATADSFYDSTSGANYNRLNVQAAIDALMPEDDFGSSVEEAYSLGTVSAGAQQNSGPMSGHITKLDDSDYFTFTAGSTGTVTFSAQNTTHDMNASWNGMGVDGWTTDGGSCTFNVVAGQQYTVALSSDDGLGYYDLMVTAESTFSFVDWGSTAVQETKSGVTIAGESFYRVQAGRDGFLTVQSTGGAGALNFELVNASLQALSTASNGRLDYYASQGEELYLRVSGNVTDGGFTLTNALSLNGSTANLLGTDGADSLIATMGVQHSLDLNGVTYSLKNINISTINVDLGGGADTLQLAGSSADDIVELRYNDTQLTSAGYAFNAIGSLDVSVFGNGGNDLARMYDTTGVDNFFGKSTFSWMTGAGYLNFAQDFDRVDAYSAAGGADTAKLWDTAADDQFEGRAGYSSMSGAGYMNYASGFSQVDAYASTGNDTAQLWDTAGDDQFYGKQEFSWMQGAGYLNFAQGFDRVDAYATAGGTDRARVWGSTGSDTLNATSLYGELYGAGFHNRAEGLARIDAYSNGGYDVANLWDSAGDDQFYGKQSFSWMQGSGFLNFVQGFDRVNAYATGGGDDRAKLWDSVGDDQFTGASTYSELVGGGTHNRAEGFDWVDAYASVGNDTAELWDTAGNDQFYGKQSFSWMQGAGYLNFAQGFDRVDARATLGGYDYAKMWDSAGNDEFNGGAASSSMTGSNFANYAWGFSRVDAYAVNGGTDVARYWDSVGDDQFHAKSGFSWMQGAGYLNFSQGFDQLFASFSQGNDWAKIYDVEAAESLTGGGSEATVSRTQYDLSLDEMDTLVAEAKTGVTASHSVGAVDYAFETVGDWA